MGNGYNIDNPYFESLWRKLNRNQRHFVTSRSEYKTLKEWAKANDLKPQTVYRWPDYVKECADLYDDHIQLAAWATLQDNVSKAALVKAAGLDSDDERIKQMSATEILDRIFGKAKQRTEHTGEGGGAIPVQIVKVGGIDPDQDI